MLLLLWELCARRARTRLHLVYLLAELAVPLSAGDTFSTQIVGKVVSWLLPPRELRVRYARVRDAVEFGRGLLIRSQGGGGSGGF
jgi:hypothetical protein